MPVRIYIFFLLLTPFLLAAQVVSKGGRFAVDFDRGCVPFELNVTELDAFGAVTRQYIYEDGAAETTSTSYTYHASDTFQIVQVIGVATPRTDTLTVIAYDPTETNFTVEKCNLNGVSITSTEEVYDFLRVYFTPTDSVQLTLGETTSFNYGSNTNQTFQTKGFYLGGKENCTIEAHDIEPLSALSTPEILTASISETCADFFVLVLEIEEVDSLINFQVEFEQTNSSILYEGKIDSTFLVFPGIAYDENEPQYCAKIHAVDICTSDVLEGAAFCEDITELTATPFSNLYSSYVEGGVLLNLDSVLTGNLMVYRKLGESGDFELRRNVQNAYMDPIGSLARPYFYRIDYADTCGQVAFSVMTNPPLLSSTTLEENNYRISLTDPVNSLTSLSALEYIVGNESTSSAFVSGGQFDVRLDPENGTRQFLRVTATYDDGTEIFSNQLTYKYTPVVYVPTAFTPNRDGTNDTLDLFGLPTETATIKIYTKWGQLIYQSIEPNPGWDGLINGRLAPEGVYLYEVTFEDSDGIKVTQKGTFALIIK